MTAPKHPSPQGISATKETAIRCAWFRCAWCRSELTPESAEPIKYARLVDRPDSENMQCGDHAACDQRQDALDAAAIVRSRADGIEPSFARASNPGVLAALEDGERLRAAMAILESGL